MIGTNTRKRIEIVVEQPLLRRVTSAIDKVGISGWTVLPVHGGKGRSGEWHEERVLSTDRLLVMTIAAQDRAERLLEALAPLLESHGLLLSMWDVDVVRGDLF